MHDVRTQALIEIFAVAFAAVLCVHPVAADDDTVPNNKLLETQIRDEQISCVQARIGDGIQRYTINHLLLRIEEIDRDLGLSERDKKKLKLVAKGTATRFGDDFQDRLKSVATSTVSKIESTFSVNGERFVLPHAKDDPDSPPEAKLVFQLTETTSSVRMRSGRGSSSYGFGGGLSTLYTRNLWKDTLNEILTAPQREKLQQLEYDRLARALATTIRAKMDVTLRLTEAQQQEMDRWLTNQIKAEFAIGTLNQGMLSSLPLKQLEFDSEGFASILTELQREYWQDYIAYQTL